MSSPLPRPHRSQRPTQAQHTRDDFASLDQAHRAALQMLGDFARLLVHLDEQGLDVQAERMARDVLGFFEGPGRHHHDEEERKVFPDLVALGDAELDALVRRLQQDHHWIEQDWRELAPHVRAVADGCNGYELPLLRAALPVFGALHRDHFTLEETVVYPAARRVKAALADGRESFAD